MFLKVSLILAAMVAAYVIANGPLKLSVELAMVFAAIVGAVASGNWLPLRHIAEGSSTYLDLALIFFTATLFMNVIKASGGLDLVVRGILSRFGDKRAVALILLMFVMLIPGALTGAGSVSVLVSGGAVAMALTYLGVSKDRITAMIFLLAGLAAVAPPVSVWAMLTCAGTAIPYVGFELPLGIPVLILGTFTVMWLGLRPTESMGDEAMALPEVDPEVSGWRTALPFIVVFGLIVASRVWPHSMPILGLPLIFLVGAIVAYALNFRKIDFFKLSSETVSQLLPLLATVISIGIVIQLMTLTGVRGLISYAVIAMPLWLVFTLLPITIPVSEGILGFGGAAVIGIPLIWMLNSVGLHPTVALSGLSLLWCLGDALPPTAIIGRLTCQTVGFEDNYSTFLKTCAVPWLAITVVGTLMVIFSRELSFLVRA